MSTFGSMYKNKQSIVLESRKLRAEFIPEPGGKLVSLINKGTGLEYMVQRKAAIYRDEPFAGVYVNGECSGFDDMFPTIDTCNYEHAPWNGIEMADHGEVWSLPWKAIQNEGSLNLTVKGVRFPYILRKKIHFIDEDTLRIDYSLLNQGDYDFEFLWAGHLMINVEEGTRLAVPEECKQMISMLSNGVQKKWDTNIWPYLNDKEGKPYRADIVRDPRTEGFEKYYFSEKVKNGFCELDYPDQKNNLKIKFSAETVPYLGILMNEKGWDNLYNIIVEPCTVCFDRPDIARQKGQTSRVAAKGQYDWYLEIKI